MRSYPQYMDTQETRVVDLSPDGLEAIPVLGEHNYKRAGGGTVAHVHPGMIEIICCRRGANISFDSAGETIPFTPGTVFVAQPETPHFLRRYPKSLSTVWIWFSLPKRGQTVLGLSRAETNWLVSRLRELPASFAATDALKQSFRRLWKLYDAAPRGTVERRLELRHAATGLMLDLLESSSARTNDAASARLDFVIDEIRRDPSRGWNLDEMAKQSAMSVAKLTGEFRRKTGLPPHAFLLFCRIGKAKELLASTAKTVGAIADILGFPSAQHFAMLFRRETGLSPREWRSSAKGKI